MNIELICILSFYLIMVFLWSMTIWGRWAEKTYDKFNSKINWYWL